MLGPPDWKDKYEDCGQGKQSPINIVKSETVEKSFSPLKITFDNARGLVTGTFKNTGHSPKLEIDDSNGASLTGGPLGDKTFELLQFHVHFGCANDRGSEHTLDGKRFSGEVSNSSKPYSRYLPSLHAHKDCWDKCKAAAVARALASHQCGPGSNPGVHATCRLSLLLVLFLASTGYSPGTAASLSPQKPTFSNSIFDQESVRRGTTLCGCATSKSLLLLLLLSLLFFFKFN